MREACAAKLGVHVKLSHTYLKAILVPKIYKLKYQVVIYLLLIRFIKHVNNTDTIR